MGMGGSLGKMMSLTTFSKVAKLSGHHISRRIYMICGFVTAIVMGFMFDSVKVVGCQSDTAACIRHVNQRISQIPEAWIESKAVIVYNQRCKLVPKGSIPS